MTSELRATCSSQAATAFGEQRMWRALAGRLGRTGLACSASDRAVEQSRQPDPAGLRLSTRHGCFDTVVLLHPKPPHRSKLLCCRRSFVTAGRVTSQSYPMNDEVCRPRQAAAVKWVMRWPRGDRKRQDQEEVRRRNCGSGIQSGNGLGLAGRQVPSEPSSTSRSEELRTTATLC